MSATSVRFDPVTGYNFSVHLLDSAGVLEGRASVDAAAAAGFSEVSGLESTLEVEDYREGGWNGTVRHFASRIAWSNLRLKQGVAHSDALWRWHYDFVIGRGRRRDGTIALHNDQQKPVRVWKFARGLPVKWRGPEMNAARAEVAIEELEIAHEGLELVDGQTLLSLGEAIELGEGLVGEAQDAFNKGKDLAQQVKDVFA